MQNKNRFESLRALAPLDAVQAWLDGAFGFGDEPALIEAIRKDDRVSLSNDQIMEVICEAIDKGLDVRTCLERLTGSA